MYSSTYIGGGVKSLAANVFTNQSQSNNTEM